MDAEILPVRQLRQYRIRNRADAELQAGTVLDQFRTVAADRPLDLVRQRKNGLVERRVVFDQAVDPAEFDLAVAVGVRHVRIHDGNHIFGGFDRRRPDIDRNAERHPAVTAGRRNLDESGVAADHAPADQLLRLMQRDGNVIGGAPLDLPPHIVADEKRFGAEHPFELGRGIILRTPGVDVTQKNVAQNAFPAARAKRLHKHPRHGPGTAYIDRFSRTDLRNGIRRGHDTRELAHSPPNAWSYSTRRRSRTSA